MGSNLSWRDFKMTPPPLIVAMKLEKIIYCFFFGLALHSYSVWAAHTEISQIEKQLSCKQVQLPVEEIEGSMAVYGYSSGAPREKPISTAFWCQRAEHDFLLVFLKNGNLFHAQCRPYLHWPWVPHGLKLIRENWALSDFMYLKDIPSYSQIDDVGNKGKRKIRRGPRGASTTGMIVQDGTSFVNYFYCFRGDWMVMQRD